MVKRLIFLLPLLLCLVAFQAVALDIDPGTMAAWGDWSFEGTRLVQKDSETGIAKFVIPVTQAGTMTYSFNVKYVDGVLEDGHGGFGIHIFADSVGKGYAWGAGNSYLLWLNYDENPRDVTAGLSAQVYKSTSDSEMELLVDYDLNWVIEKLAGMGYTVDQVLSQPIPIKIVVNGNTGDVKFYDPIVENYVYTFKLPISHPLFGNYVALRTNGMSVSFGMGM